jgi:phosphoglycolate phosphatase-like HAD superfamily hydrolase
VTTSAVLFDVDGTLIDSNDAHARAWASALADGGYDVPFDRIRPLMGMGGERMLAQIADGLAAESERGKWIAERRLEIFLTRELPDVRLIPGARRLLETVRARGGRVVVATSAKREELETLLSIGNLKPLVDLSTTSDDVRASKPAPDIISAALANASASERDAVMIGDTHYDIEAAQKARVPCVALRCGGSDPATLRDADVVYAGPIELIEKIDRAPFSWASA